MLKKYYPTLVFSICTNKNVATVMSLPILFCVLMWWARQQQQCKHNIRQLESFRYKNHVTMLTQYMSITSEYTWVHLRLRETGSEMFCTGPKRWTSRVYVLFWILKETQNIPAVTVGSHPLGTKDNSISTCGTSSITQGIAWTSLRWNIRPASAHLCSSVWKLSGLLICKYSLARFRLSWRFRYGCCVYQETKGYCFRTSFGCSTQHTQNREWTELHKYTITT